MLSANDEDKEKIETLKKTIADAREGKVEFTLIIEDLDGNSGIVSKKAVKSVPVPPEEETEDCKDSAK